MMKTKMMPGGGMRAKMMAGGGVGDSMPMNPETGKPTFVGDGKGKMNKGGSVKTAKPAMGSASKRADGIAVKGKTKGTMMAKGGKISKMKKSGGAY